MKSVERRCSLQPTKVKEEQKVTLNTCTVLNVWRYNLLLKRGNRNGSKHKNPYIGFEISEEYCNMAHQRIFDETAQISWEV